jgi:hypothetical protein
MEEDPAKVKHANLARWTLRCSGARGKYQITCLQNPRFHHPIVLDSDREFLQGEKYIYVDTIRLNRPLFITKFHHDIGILTIFSSVAVIMKSALFPAPQVVDRGHAVLFHGSAGELIGEATMISDFPETSWALCDHVIEVGKLPAQDGAWQSSPTSIETSAPRHSVRFQPDENFQGAASDAHAYSYAQTHAGQSDRLVPYKGAGVSSEYQHSQSGASGTVVSKDADQPALSDHGEERSHRRHRTASNAISGGPDDPTAIQVQITHLRGRRTSVQLTK